MIHTHEYIWLDGNSPQLLRSKTLVTGSPTAGVWNFDGSSTRQSEGDSADLVIKPVSTVKDPLRENGHLHMCEVFEQDGETPHESNTRATLRGILDDGGHSLKPWIGFEQEYTLQTPDKSHIYGWPENGAPLTPQGPYYCGVGPAQIQGRNLVEAHLKACIDAGIQIYGVNAEVMLSQWEFQIGPRKVTEFTSLLTICDHLWLARWLLFRIGEDFGAEPSLDVKPVDGDWNGAGMHTNFSTEATRAEGGYEKIQEVIPVLESRHQQHIGLYGQDLHKRLTGLHETCDINTFKSGKSDRGSSIRIPNHVSQDGKGYFEDRRPGANANPYDVARLLTEACLEAK